jgi:hypothetical protein
VAVYPFSTSTWVTAMPAQDGTGAARRTPFHVPNTLTKTEPGVSHWGQTVFHVV